VLGFAVDFIAEAMDVDIDDVGGGVDAHLPDVVEDHGAGDDTADIAAKVFEEGEFLLGELELDAGAAGFAADEIDFEVGDAEAGGFRLARGAAAEQSAEAGLELGYGEGLGHVIVATAFEAEDALIDGAARGEDEDRGADTLRAEALDQLEAVDVGEGEVDDHSVVDAFEGEAFGFGSVGAGVDAKAGFGEGPGKKLTNGGVIFDDEQPHGSPLVRYEVPAAWRRCEFESSGREVQDAFQTTPASNRAQRQDYNAFMMRSKGDSVIGRAAAKGVSLTEPNVGQCKGLRGISAVIPRRWRRGLAAQAVIV
jgi:hypothetical protein